MNSCLILLKEKFDEISCEYLGEINKLFNSINLPELVSKQLKKNDILSLNNSNVTIRSASKNTSQDIEKDKNCLPTNFSRNMQ